MSCLSFIFMKYYFSYVYFCPRLGTKNSVPLHNENLVVYNKVEELWTKISLQKWFCIIVCVFREGVGWDEPSWKPLNPIVNMDALAMARHSSIEMKCAGGVYFVVFWIRQEKHLEVDNLEKKICNFGRITELRRLDIVSSEAGGNSSWRVESQTWTNLLLSTSSNPDAYIFY